jgi:TonB family protein
MPTHLLAVFLLLTCLATTAASQDPAPERVHVANEAMRGLLIKRVAPNYPPLARQARIQGTVMLNAVINKSGDVEDLLLISGHPMLAPAAIFAVKQWKYQPYQINGEPIDVETNIQVNFRLSDSPSGIVGDMPGGAPPGTVGSILTNTPPPATDPDTPHPAIPQRVRVSAGVESSLMRIRVNPEYPPDARTQGIQGVVNMRVIIDKEGNVSQVDLISGHPLLAQSAIDAVKQWKYRPFLLNGMPMEVESTVVVNFTLAGS